MTTSELEAIEQADAEKVDAALACLKHGDLAGAEPLLRDVCSRTPAAYDYEFLRDRTWHFRVWDLEAFLEAIARLDKAEGENAVWIKPAYPRAWYYLGYLLIEAGDLEGALDCFKNGRDLEPQNPKFLNEMGVVYSRQRRTARALKCYEEALTLPHAPESDRATSLRGGAFQLIDLGRMGEARQRLEESLVIDPDSEVARNELAYIAQSDTGGR